MGRAIVREPQVFLMDEPLSNLDAKLRVQMRSDISKLQHELGTTTIYVTHDQVEAMTMGDRVAVMSKGVLQQVAAPQTLYDEPANLFVAGFIGTPPMNLLAAAVTADGDGVSVRVADTTLPVGEEALSRYPRLRESNGRTVALGVRADDLHPAEENGTLPTITAEVELVEALGGESMAYFRVGARPIDAVADSAEASLQSADGDSVVGTRPDLVASFPPHVAIRIGDSIPVGVDTRKLHFFDEQTGEPLR
jgi:multiple sugar transport system ATP-binding protein